MIPSQTLENPTLLTSIRLRRIGKNKNELNSHSDKLKQKFLARGYNHNLIENDTNKTINNHGHYSKTEHPKIITKREAELQ